MATATDRTKKLLEERDHLRDCPMERVESWRDVRPGNPDRGIPPRQVVVARCIDCGAHLTKEID